MMFSRLISEASCSVGIRQVLLREMTADYPCGICRSRAVDDGVFLGAWGHDGFDGTARSLCQIPGVSCSDFETVIDKAGTSCAIGLKR